MSLVSLLFSTQILNICCNVDPVFIESFISVVYPQAREACELGFATDEAVGALQKGIEDFPRPLPFNVVVLFFVLGISSPYWLNISFNPELLTFKTSLGVCG